MATQHEIDLALMAGRAYQSTRDEINWFPIPDGWKEMLHKEGDGGFEAVSFYNGTDLANSSEIVISYAGTFDKSYADVLADIELGVFGVSATQLYQAAEYYLQVKAANPDAHITITGHSLGGGLASLVAIFFNAEAITFDQAPFRNSASWITATELRNYLATSFPESTYPQISNWLAPLDRFISSFDPLGLGWSEDGLAAREANVTNQSVQGEFLSIANAFRIGTELPSLTHGDYSGPFDLHSQSLLTAFLQNDQFRQVTNKLPELLGMIFDSALFYHDPNDKENPEPNFLENLIRHETGVDGSFAADGMLTRFTYDLWQIAENGGLTMSNNDLTKALIAFDMQAYYDNRLTGTNTLFNYEGVTGGIHFDRDDVAATYSNTNVKGYQYFVNYLATLPEDERAAITLQLPDLTDWYIQVGSQAMTATAADQRAFMLGGSGEDQLTGGSQADVLVGNGGNDYLEGGGGQDYLYGGAGDDIIYFEGEDTYADTLVDGGAGFDTLKGTEGADDLDLSRLTNVQNIEKIALSGGDDTLTVLPGGGFGGFLAIDGGAGTNRIEGTDGDDVIDLSGITVTNIAQVTGGDGDDTLADLEGNDFWRMAA